MKEIEQIIQDGYRDDVSFEEIDKFNEAFGLLKMLEHLKTKTKKGKQL